MNKKLLIVAAYHKQAYVPNSDIILPMQVGASVAKVQLNMVKDNVGENISELNPYYCELTALYSLWRNYSDVEYYGLCHYRRFFSYRHRNFANHFFQDVSYYGAKLVHVFKTSIRYSKLPYILVSERNLNFEIEKFEKQILKEITANRFDFYYTNEIVNSEYTNYWKFAFICGSKSLDELRNIIEKYYPDYLNALDETYNSHELHSANMVILRRGLFEKYADFLFSILNQHLKKFLPIELQSASCYMYLRQSGYLAEILTDVFVRKMKEEGMKGKALNILYVVPDNGVKARNMFCQCLMKIGIFHVKFLK